jgi:hypothetical protein
MVAKMNRQSKMKKLVNSIYRLVVEHDIYDSPRKFTSDDEELLFKLQR